jgi:GDSL-like Lipase/Acylhydrolase family
VMTMLVMFGMAELVSRAVFTSREYDACLVPDARLGLRYKPDCTSLTKSFESPWVTYHYNECGYRGEASCGPVPPGVRRVVLLGSSLASGYLVPEQQTYAARSAEELSQRCGAPVQVQNLGGTLIFWTRVVNRVDDALRLKPDAALLQISTYDLEHPDPGEGPENGSHDVVESKNILLRLQDFLKETRTWSIMQHYLFQNEDFYLSLYLRSGSKSAYLRDPLSSDWQARLRAFDGMLGKIADRFRQAGVPLAVVFVPQRAQAGLAANTKRPQDVHPYLINQALQKIAASHGSAFIDTTQTIADSKNVTDLYYAVDGHLDGEGQTLIAPTIVNGMVAALPPFRHCTVSK